MSQPAPTTGKMDIGQQVISTSHDKTLKLWNLQTGENERTFHGHSAWVTAIALTPNGKQVIFASWNHTFKLWNLETGEDEPTFQGHSDRVTAAAFTPDGKQVISGSDDNALKLWNLETGEEIATFTGEAPFLCCAVAADGVTIVAGESSGRVHFLRLENV